MLVAVAGIVTVCVTTPEGEGPLLGGHYGVGYAATGRAVVGPFTAVVTSTCGVTVMGVLLALLVATASAVAEDTKEVAVSEPLAGALSHIVAREGGIRSERGHRVPGYQTSGVVVSATGTTGHGHHVATIGQTGRQLQAGYHIGSRDATARLLRSRSG